ncbi:Glycoside hydrolase [Macleaya cordata]|uniref:Glycoside hydrolase n=1 Tax=Macleaya cordata TaxID=56857 RepID=A0A200QJL7_MACCD|nr:Glycoside hydrolase [Macleaya cordata]
MSKSTTTTTVLILLISQLLFIILQSSSTNAAAAVVASYNIINFGAKSDGRTDSTKSFLQAWASACSSIKPATLYVPKGQYLIKQAVFEGPCKSRVIIQIDGTLVAPMDYWALANSRNWILFDSIDGVSINGGTLDGRGSAYWACKIAGQNCPQGAMILRSEVVLYKSLLSCAYILFITSLSYQVNAENLNNLWVRLEACGAAGEGVIRDDQGILLVAFHSFYGSGSNNLAETRALLDGLLLCQQLGITNIIVKVDSNLVAGWYNQECSIPWHLSFWWQRIREATENLNINLKHVYRELNSSADCMASLGLSSRSNCSITTDFLMRLVGLTCLDRLRMPYIRLAHLSINRCSNVMVRKVKIIAPDGSPNTDGIHVQTSTHVTITDSSIKTGDDCISIGPGAQKVLIERVGCGPGHGISIGSLAKDLNEEGVQDITVRDVVFTGSDNGLRIKSWARPSNGFVRNVLYQNIVMNNVRNPILIDQRYCPSNQGCPNQHSGIKISGVTYQNVRGTSATPVAVKFQCSVTNPCNGIKLQNIKLTHFNKPAQSVCLNAAGTTSGSITPGSCL